MKHQKRENTGSIVLILEVNIIIIIIITENIISEDFIVTVKVFDFCVILLPYPFFKTDICHHSLSYSKVNLIFDPDCSSCCISKNGPAMKMNLWSLTSISTWQTTRVFNNELIGWKQISYFVFIPRQNCIFLWNYDLLSYTRIALHWTSKLKNYTLELDSLDFIWTW